MNNLTPAPPYPPYNKLTPTPAVLFLHRKLNTNTLLSERLVGHQSEVVLYRTKQEAAAGRVNTKKKELKERSREKNKNHGWLKYTLALYECSTGEHFLALEVGNPAGQSQHWLLQASVRSHSQVSAALLTHNVNIYMRLAVIDINMYAFMY